MCVLILRNLKHRFYSVSGLVSWALFEVVDEKISLISYLAKNVTS